jgi:hypothetical protein
MVEEPMQDLDVPSETIREEEQEDFKEEEECDNCDDHENEEGQLAIVSFHSRTIGSFVQNERARVHWAS